MVTCGVYTLPSTGHCTLKFQQRVGLGVEVLLSPRLKLPTGRTHQTVQVHRGSCCKMLHNPVKACESSSKYLFIRVLPKRYIFPPVQAVKQRPWVHHLKLQDFQGEHFARFCQVPSSDSNFPDLSAGIAAEAIPSSESPCRNSGKATRRSASTSIASKTSGSTW